MTNILPPRISDVIDDWQVDERNVKFRAYVLLPVTEQGIHYAIDKVLADKNRPDLRFAVYMIVKELAMNAVKANLKVAYFAEINVALEEGDAYSSAVRQFHDLLSEDWAMSYAYKARARNMFVDIWLICDEDSFTVKVLNNRPISEFELLRFRKKLAKALETDDLYEVSDGENEEGAGMGLMLIINIFRSLNLPPEALEIDTDNKSATVVQFRIPLRDGDTKNEH